jgi:hypothetical protein
MVESSSSAVPGDVEWLPGPGGSRVLRIPASPEPPALILRVAEGVEKRIEAGPGPDTAYAIPDALDWSAAWLQWPDGTRVTVPPPHGPHAEVIQLRPRRREETGEAAHGEVAADVSETVSAGSEGAPAGDTAEPADTPVVWTTPPEIAQPSGGDAETLWRARRDELARELADATAAIARARDNEISARDAVLAALAAARADLRASRAARAADASALAALAGELDAERSAHAVTRGSIGTLADALASTRLELAATKASGADAHAGLAGARAEAASLREALDSERAARAAAEAVFRESVEAERLARAAAEAKLQATVAPGREQTDRSSLLERVADLDRHAAGLRDQVELERHAREQAEAAAAAARRPPEESAQLLANLDAAAAALRATAKPTDPTSAPPADGLGRSGHVVAAETASTELAAAETHSTDLVVPNAGVRLRHALVAFANEDPLAAGALLVGLVPAQAAVLDGGLTYDLTVRGVGTFAVFVEDGSARVVRLSRRRPRGEALFHLAGDPVRLAELLAGDRRKVGRLRRKARLTGNRKRARALMALPGAQLSLAQAVRAGARLEPALVYQALPFAIDPQWTRGHNFTVAQQIVELAPQAWHITVRDGRPLRAVERNSVSEADATVTMTRAAFDRLLRDEPAALGDRPVIRGDREAVAALKRWTDLARGA